LQERDRAAISVYAKGDDYHDLIKARLKDVARWLIAHAGGDVKVFVDTAAVMEKPLAAKSGLGWQGKHTNMVSRDFGSWLFLGAIFTTLDLPPDDAAKDNCGSCSACLDACPTAAFPAPYRLDARRCISYLTIEHKGPIPRALRPLMGNRIFGCDDCLAVCPWNKFAERGREAKLAARDVLRAPTLAELSRLDDAQFRALFAKTSIKRTGRDRFIRNVLNAIGNSGDMTLVPEAERLLDDASPLVRGAAVWALSRLLPKENFSSLAARAIEDDASVKDAWAVALSSPLPSGEVGSRSDPGEGLWSQCGSLAPSPQPSPPRGEGVRRGRSNRYIKSESKLRHRVQQPFDVLRPGQAMITVLDQGQHHVVAGKTRHQFDRVPPRHVGVLHALQDMHRATRLDQPAQQQMLAAFVNELPGDRIRFRRIFRRP
jgi:epoxyqueuosine reductase